MKAVKAWAVVYKEEPHLYSGQLPIFWRKAPAEWFVGQHPNNGLKIVSVEIREVKKKGRKRK